MSIYFGNDTVNDLYVGPTPVSKGYVGTHLFHNGDNTVIDITYEKYILNAQFNTLYNTAEEPVKSATLKGSTKYRDIDTGDILDTFDETKNLELVSVKVPVLTTTGKNLICVGRGYDNSVTINGVTITRDVVNQTITFDGTCTADNTNVPLATFNHQMKTGERYVLSAHLISGTSGEVYFRVNTSNWSDNMTCKYTSGSLAKIDYAFKKDYLYNSSSIRIDSGQTFNNAVFKVMLEKIVDNSITPSYKPYKSNILTTNEEVELHGVGGVKDELNLLTGELTQRIGEVVFDGSENWIQSGMADPRIFYISINDMAHKEDYRNSISCDKFVTYIGEGYLTDSTLLNGITGYIDSTDTYPNENWIYIKSADSEGSVEKLKQWLSQNPITVRYELTTESLKTVDLSVVDQDGNNTELKTFDDITYVTLSSEGAIPEAELEVATKNEKVLSTLSLEMDDIFTSQNTLEETANTQSENVDATMMATTEIYEQLL